MADDFFTGEWFWYAGTNDEWYDVGPFTHRQDAIDEHFGQWGKDVGCHLVEARQDNLDLSRLCNVEYMLDDTIENASEDYGYEGEAPELGATSEQLIELEDRIRKTIRDWQVGHKIDFKPRVFTHSRNHDFIPGTEDSQ